jgi:polyribonucleotide nucleotidyltransferase
MQQALDAVRALTEEVEVGRIYTGTVRRIVDFGAFVEILPGKEGLVRTSQLADYQVMRPDDVVSVGDEITVMAIEVDPQGRINLSRRAALSGELPSSAELESERGASRGGPRGGGGSRGGGGYGMNRDNAGRGPGGYNDRGGYGGGRGGYNDRDGGGRGGYDRGGTGGGGGYGQRRPMGPAGPAGGNRDRGGNPPRREGYGQRSDRRW